MSLMVNTLLSLLELHHLLCSNILGRFSFNQSFVLDTWPAINLALTIGPRDASPNSLCELGLLATCVARLAEGRRPIGDEQTGFRTVAEGNHQLPQERRGGEQQRKPYYGAFAFIRGQAKKSGSELIG
jgi:hypothetical protein